MKTFKLLGASLAAILSVALISQSATAQETVQDAQRNRDRSPDRSQIGSLDSKTSGATIRASKLIGMNIQNEPGKDVGKVHDIVLDTNTGKARYLAVTYGGFLGFGNKLFAVPFEAFACHQDPNDRDRTLLVLNVTQQQLDGAEGFDDDYWPDFGDPKFTSELDRRYGIDRQSLRDRDRDHDRGVGVRVDRDGVDVDVDRNRIPE